MAERRKNRKKKDLDIVEDDGKPTNDEYAVAKYLRQKLPLKKTSLQGHKVEYFIASKAVDLLLDSPWATNTGPEGVKFTTRESIVRFLDRMLEHKFFHRAKKIIVNKKKKDQESVSEEKDKESKSKESKKSKSKSDEKLQSKDKSEEKTKGKEDKKSKDKSEEKTKGKDKSDEQVKSKDKVEEKDKQEDKSKSDKKSSDSQKTEEKDKKADEEAEGENDDKKETDGSEKKKEKKKIKLDMHFKQLFLDGNEVYVWIYNPIPMRTWIVGMLMVVGAVLVCLFPLWPQVIRHYIYYLSVAAALFLVFIIALAVVRLIVFVVVWAFTLGKHHLWLLPNLTEDVGFFESFWPLYFYEYKGKKKEDSDSSHKKSKSVEEDTTEHQEAKEKDKSDSSSDQDKKQDQESESERDSEEENVDKTTTVENGFELVEAEDES